MESFEELFDESEGKPILYNGELLFIADCLQVWNGDRFRIILEEFNSEWRQGISLSLSAGSIVVGGRSFTDGIVVWQDTAPKQFVILVQSKNLKAVGLFVYNVWHTGQGGTQHGHNGAAMKKEELADGSIRYWCNDGYPDDDLNDIVFRIEKLGPAPKKDKKAGWRRALKLARSQ